MRGKSVWASRVDLVFNTSFSTWEHPNAEVANGVLKSLFNKRKSLLTAGAGPKK